MQALVKCEKCGSENLWMEETIDGFIHVLCRECGKEWVE